MKHRDNAPRQEIAVVNADPATVAGKDIAFTAGDEPVAEVLARI